MSHFSSFQQATTNNCKQLHLSCINNIQQCKYLNYFLNKIRGRLYLLSIDKLFFRHMRQLLQCRFLSLNGKHGEVEGRGARFYQLVFIRWSGVFKFYQWDHLTLSLFQLSTNFAGSPRRKLTPPILSQKLKFSTTHQWWKPITTEKGHVCFPVNDTCEQSQSLSTSSSRVCNNGYIG